MALVWIKQKQQLSYDFDDFVWIPTMAYKCLGYDFLETIKSKWLQHLLKIYLFLTVCGNFYCKYYLYLRFYHVVRDLDTPNIIPTATYVSYSIDSNIKLLVFVLNYKRIRKICNILRAEHPQTKGQRRIYRVSDYYWSRKVRLFMLFYSVSCAIVILMPFIQSIFLYIQNINMFGYADARFPYLKSYPQPYNFNYKTPVGYGVAFVIELLNSFFSGGGNIGTDCWLISLILQLCMHFDYIARMLEAYEPQRKNTHKDCEFLKDLINKHQLLLSLIDELNSIFGLSLMFTIMSTANSLCIISIQLIFQGMGMDFLRFGIFLGSYTAQFYIVCYYGQNLIDVSQTVYKAAYKSKWYNGSKEYKLSIFTIIVRSQKQAELIAKGITQPISLDTFKIVMHMTYRVFAVMRTMLEN